MNGDSAEADPPDERRSYWLTRFVLLRLLGFIYAVAFLAAARQLVPLIGSHGLLPLDDYLHRAGDYYGSRAEGFRQLPSLFWFFHSDRTLLAASWTGFALACVVTAGYANGLLLLVLWALYMSIVHLGQDWYAYGWETQLLETGILAVFLCPLLDGRPFSRRPPPEPVLWLFRWLAFRIMLGSGLIKLRGDPIWRDGTALYYHFETQPIPNPLSRWFHFLPKGVLRIGVGLNHLAELVAPWFVFWPRIGRLLAGTVIILFQVVIILSGNLSFLNWLTIVPALACIDDAAWAKVLPGFLVRRARAAAAAAEPSRPMILAAWLYLALAAVLSVQPAANLLSNRQIMNTSFDRLDLVNTYGAFGSVGKERANVVFEGTDSEFPTSDSDWKEYPYRYLPTKLDHRPPQIAPYQPRLDWAMWFASMASPAQYPWTVHLAWKLLHNDPGTLGLFAANPFPDHPPRFVRAVLYIYRFAPAGNPQKHWWERRKIGLWLPELSAEDPRIKQFLAAYGWK